MLVSIVGQYSQEFGFAGMAPHDVADLRTDYESTGWTIFVPRYSN